MHPLRRDYAVPRRLRDPSDFAGYRSRVGQEGASEVCALLSSAVSVSCHCPTSSALVRSAAIFAPTRSAASVPSFERVGSLCSRRGQCVRQPLKNSQHATAFEFRTHDAMSPTTAQRRSTSRTARDTQHMCRMAGIGGVGHTRAPGDADD